MEAYIFETSGGLKADDKHSRAVRISSARGLDATRMSQTSLKALEDIEEAQSSGKWKPIVSALGQLLRLSPEERRLVVDYFRRLSQPAEAGQ